MDNTVVMSHYISPTNAIYGFDNTQEGLIPAGYVLIPDTFTPDQYPYLSLVNGSIVFDSATATADSMQVAIHINTAAIQKVLDATAQSRGYTDIKAACAYASSTPFVGSDPVSFLQEKFRIEGNALQSWMSLTWATAYTYLATVKAGTNPMPTPDQAVALMPTFTWPD